MREKLFRFVPSRSVWLGLFVLGVSILFLIIVGRWLLQSISDADPAVTSSVVLVGGSIVVATITYWHNKSKDRAEAHREKKVEIYNKFVSYINNLLSAHVLVEGFEISDKEDEIMKFMVDFRGDIILWAGPKVIGCWNKTLSHSDVRSPDSGEPKNVLLLWDDVLRAMRADLGLSNFGLKRGDIVKLFVRGSDHHLFE